MTIKDNITIHQKITRKGKLGRYYSTISLSQLLLGPNASNIFGRLLRHIQTFCVCVQNFEHRLCIGYLLTP